MSSNSRALQLKIHIFKHTCLCFLFFFYFTLLHWTLILPPQKKLWPVFETVQIIVLVVNNWIVHIIIILFTIKYRLEICEGVGEIV